MIEKTTPLRVLLLDSNPYDIDRLRLLLRSYPMIEIAGETTMFRQALEWIAQNRIDVLFLESASKEGCLLDECHLIPSSVKLVFHTSDQLAAVRAFELDAVDFLTKPLTALRLKETIRRLLRLDWSQRSSSSSSSHLDQKFLIPFERGRRGASLDEISFIQAFGNYTRVSLGDGQSEIVLRSLVKWQQLLPTPPFLRVHRNTIVQINQVRRLEEVDSGCVLCMKKVDERIPISRRCLPQVRRTLFAHAA